MIHYDLRCSEGHEFDGWYKDSAAFDRLAKRGLVECPTCGDTKVQRAMMRPGGRQGRGAARAQSRPPAPPAPSQPAAAGSGRRRPDARADARHAAAMRAEVEKHCDYVGPEFAEEARKIHRGESDKRGIYGETSPEQAEALTDEGIEFSRIPWVPRADG